MRLSFLFYAGRFRSQLHFNHARARPPARSYPKLSFGIVSFRAAPSFKLNGVMGWRSTSDWLSPPMFVLDGYGRPADSTARICQGVS